ncbi:hypothetical protein N7528_010289 [Penicillium herquei]|nr:hypothetical protein N7528_010289 [Penicillium herquei]
MSGRHAPRSKKGCLSCRVRKLKCDEQRPECLRCKTGFIKCEWYSVPIRRRSARKEAVPRESCRPLQPSIDQSFVAADGFTYQIEFHELMHNFQPILTRSLGTDHIPLQNSVILGPNDRELFQFFPCSILAFNYGKGWEWSALSYIYNNTAKYNSGVMNMIMAMSAKELQVQRLRRNSHNLSPDPSVSEAGDAHYCLALNELSQLLRTSASLTDDNIDTILAIFFLMVFYEALFGHNNTTTSIRLQGLMSFFQNYIQLSGSSGHQLSIDRLPALSQHLLLLTLYVQQR